MTVILVLVLGVILSQWGGRPFSPGLLSAASRQSAPLGGYNSHADFESECSRCHQPWRGIAADRCQECHVTVEGERANGTGLHGLLPGSDRCQACHSEHQGRSAGLIDFDLAGFEHDRLTGFSLIQHQLDYDSSTIQCDHCHTSGFSEIGDQDCLTCHLRGDAVFMTDHTALFGEACLACHDGLDTMASFVHQDLFPLDGGHAGLDCARCHQPTILAGAPATCAGCHPEPAVHAGSFGSDCARCHTAAGWQPASLTQHTFPLDHGGEGMLDCQACHTQTYTSHTCTDCHAHDLASTRAEHREEGITDIEDCAGCHPTGKEEEED